MAGLLVARPGGGTRVGSTTGVKVELQCCAKAAVSGVPMM